VREREDSLSVGSDKVINVLLLGRASGDVVVESDDLSFSTHRGFKHQQFGELFLIGLIGADAFLDEGVELFVPL
jgi:hypothetical protein